MAGTLHTDPRGDVDAALARMVVNYVEVGRHERSPVERAVDLQRTRDKPRTAAPSDARPRLERAHEDSLRHAGLARDEVEAPVHAVREVDVGVSGSAEHDLGACGAPPTLRMGGEVVRTQVRLDLDQAAPPRLAVDLADQDLVQQVSRNDACVAFEKRGWKDVARR